MKLDTLLHALGADDWMRVRDSVEALETRLRVRDFDDAEVCAIAERLTSLAEHPKWEVRRSVARVARYLRHEAHRAIVQRLLQDSNARVRLAAEATREHRTERARIDLLPQSADARMEELLRRVEATHGALAREAAMRVGRAYTEFMVRALSHEITSALSPLANALELAEVSIQHPEADRAIAHRHLQRSRERLQDVSKIVEATRAYVSETVLEYREESVHEIIHHAADGVRSHPLARANGLALALDVDPALVIDAHRGPLVQVFTNLLKNAIEASEERRPIEIHVTAKRVKGHVEIAVADRGVGMTAEDILEAQRPFRSRKPGGTGLGLPLVKKLVESEHRGAVRIESRPGHGTTITVVLPVSQEM